MDQLDQLSNMKYADLLKLAKQKLNITKRITKVGKSHHILSYPPIWMLNFKLEIG